LIVFVGRTAWRSPDDLGCADSAPPRGTVSLVGTILIKLIIVNYKRIHSKTFKVEQCIRWTGEKNEAEHNLE
jgi:hypothetical protein